LTKYREDPKKTALRAIYLTLVLLAPCVSIAAGVTVITHGYSSDVNSWVRAMADQIPHNHWFKGTNFTIYTITLTTDGSNYSHQWSRTNGSPPSVTDSGEIIVKLDWSEMAGGLSGAGRKSAQHRSGTRHPTVCAPPHNLRQLFQG
jgi:hypothetical protein